MIRTMITITSTTNRVDHESGVSQVMEYTIISGVLLLFLVITIPMVNDTFIERPTNILTSHAYTDIGNGVSTRIIDLYAILPYGNPAKIATKFDVPDDVAGKDYIIEILPGPADRPRDNRIIISGSSGISTTVSLAGIGETIFGLSEGRTTASGLNSIEYEYP